MALVLTPYLFLYHGASTGPADPRRPLYCRNSVKVFRSLLTDNGRAVLFHRDPVRDTAYPSTFFFLFLPGISCSFEELDLWSLDESVLTFLDVCSSSSGGDEAAAAFLAASAARFFRASSSKPNMEALGVGALKMGRCYRRSLSLGQGTKRLGLTSSDLEDLLRVIRPPGILLPSLNTSLRVPSEVATACAVFDVC